MFYKKKGKSHHCIRRLFLHFFACDVCKEHFCFDRDRKVSGCNVLANVSMTIKANDEHACQNREN